MTTITVSRDFPASVHEAERCWHDTARWRAWVDGLDRVEEVSPEWPAVGARVRWRSGPAGRGEVVEHVTEHEPLSGLTVDVCDDSIDGRQSVRFIPSGDGAVTIELTLRYRIRRRSPLTRLIDALFIRGPMRASLESTLSHFGSELATARAEADI
jgi:Polyketide cyclase / dehydrase and lipid transport